MQHKGEVFFILLFSFLDMCYDYETDPFWFGPVSEQKKIVCWNRCFIKPCWGSYVLEKGALY